MKITSQEEYGLRCLLRLARAGGESLTIPEIAAAEGMSAPYVAKLLSILRHGGLIESVRGRAGGYRLAGSPSQFSLGSVLLVLGEPLFEESAYCQQHAGTETDGNCVHHGGCTLRALWHTLEHWMRHTLDQITLADLLYSEGRITELLRSRLAEAVLETPAEAPSDLIALTGITRPRAAVSKLES
ncbi:MAG TPA: Rrf2 family transcriptional regulator [Gemmataceae bacterium]|nr:Rrf2 family transcriptional regulator [Gemmataceae bacterium]